MIAQFVDLFFQFFSPENLPKLPLNHQLNEAADGVGDDPGAEDNENNGEGPSAGSELVNLCKTNGRKRDDGHVERIESRPTFDDDISERAENDGKNQNKN